MNVFAGAFASLGGAYQKLTCSCPVLTFGTQRVSCLPGEKPVDLGFVDGGTADAGKITVQTNRCAWSTLPAKLQTLTITGLASAPDGTYQVLDLTHREGVLLLTLGNIDAQ